VGVLSLENRGHYDDAEAIMENSLISLQTWHRIFLVAMMVIGC
jgi:hypothetical protein